MLSTMLKSLLEPGPGLRTYRLHQQALFAGAALALLGILKGTDLIGLASLVAIVMGVAGGTATWNNVSTARALAASNGAANGSASTPKKEGE